MNTILHLAAVLATLWASIFTYDTLSQPALGGSLLVLFFGFIVMTVSAFDDDLFLITGKKIFGFRGDQREGLTAMSKLALGVTIAMLSIATLEYALR
jgi:hypothetical protein|tara:strand:+ start:223 stop:513 length:291 start_codon:yes stop_codon:yes gene_type:complete